MEKEKNIQNSTPGSKRSKQYDNLSFGGTSNKGIPEFFNNPVNMNSNENIHDTIPSTNKSLSQEQFEMDTTMVEKKLEEARFDSHQSFGQINLDNSKATDMPKSHGNMQTITTDNAFSNRQYMNMYDYCHQLLGKVSHMVEDYLKPVLSEIYIDGADCLLENLEIPLFQHDKMVFKKPLETFADILQLSCEILNQYNSEKNAHSSEKESNETAEKSFSALDEHNYDQVNIQLQESAQSNLMSTVLQETCSTSPSLSLTELLLQAREQLKQLELVKLEVDKQPQKFWKKRYISCLCGKSCPYIQSDSGIQKEYPLIKWSKLTNENLSNLFMLVELLSYNNERHPTKIIVPPKTTLKQANVVSGKRKRSKVRCTLDDLVIDEMYGFDKESNRILCPMTEGECCQCEKELMVKVIGLYTISENQETDDDEEEEEDISIQNEINKLFKFRICLCRRTGNGKLERISNFIDTQWVEESKGNKSLAINPSEVTPQYLCECGNEIITVPLNTDSEKEGFVVRLNGDELKAAEIRGVKDKQIFFNSRLKRKGGQNYLHVQVSKESALKTIMDNHNPDNGLDENELLNMKIYYVQISDNAHEHRFPVQSNEMIEDSE